jgi:hypothetical protein
MMPWQDDSNEKKRQLWKSRVARERLDLSASVEEALNDGSAQDELEADELDDARAQVPTGEGNMLIPPRLSLQSKQMPAVQALTKVRTGYVPIAIQEGVVSPTTEFSRAVQNKQRSPRRTTKVRLQVVPKPGVIEKSAKVSLPPYEPAMNLALPAVDNLQGRDAQPILEVSAEMSGIACFERGQAEVMVASTHITPASVVVVVLTADPGPVVVQYVSLQPKVGFTVHLSAAAKNTTSFNYRIC